jgi:hypothetical protein
VAQDLTPPSPGPVDGARPYSLAEEDALSLAADLRERVQRERATIAKLQAYLSGRRPAR